MSRRVSCVWANGLVRALSSSGSPLSLADSEGCTNTSTRTGRLETKGTPMSISPSSWLSPRGLSSTLTRPSLIRMLPIENSRGAASSAGASPPSAARRSSTSDQLCRPSPSSANATRGRTSASSCNTSPLRTTDSISRLARSDSKLSASPVPPASMTRSPPTSALRRNGLISTRSMLTSRPSVSPSNFCA